MLYEIDPLTDPRWPEFLAENSQASAFHSRGWLETIFTTYGHRPAVLTTSGPNGKLANGVAFCRVDSWITGLRLVSLPFSDHCEPLAGNLSEREELLAGLEGHVAKDCRYIEIRPSSPSCDSIRPEWRPSQTFCWHRLDLRPGPDAVFRHFHRDCIQRRIRHAEKQGIEIVEGRTPRILKNFYRLVVSTRRRHGLPPQPLAWFRNMVDCMGESVTIRCATKDGLPIAAILTLQHGKSMYYKYGASLACFHRIGAVPYLFWSAIQDAIAHGLEEFDMGRSDCDNPGLITFKERWAATCSTISYLRFPADSPRRIDTSQWNRNFRLRACRLMPDKCLAGIGALSYRHID